MEISILYQVVNSKAEDREIEREKKRKKNETFRI